MKHNSTDYVDLQTKKVKIICKKFINHIYFNNIIFSESNNPVLYVNGHDLQLINYCINYLPVDPFFIFLLLFI